MKKYIFAAVLILAAVTFAQTADKVILVSDATSVDMLIAKAAGEKTGVPVLVLANGALDDGIRAELASLGAKTVYLVGGPAVISAGTETELQAKYTVVRLWGYERTGTAVAVARHFWSEGAPCAVVADDTKNSETDTDVQAQASEEAVTRGCPFFPVPKGTVPAEVLSAINELNITNATFVGKEPSGEFRSALAKLVRREIVGDIKKIQSDIEDGAEKSTKLLIIAAPNWKYVLGHAGHENDYTTVRIVNSASSVPDLAALAQAKNITDVRVLGEPTLAGQIADQLKALGINVTKISGDTPAKTALEALKKTIGGWEDKKQEASDANAEARSKIKAKLADHLADMKDRLNALDAEIASLNASGRNTAELQAKVDAAQNQLSAIQSYLDNGNLDVANVNIDRALGGVESLRWTNRSVLGIDDKDDVDQEEESVGHATNTPDLGAIESRLAALAQKCNSSSIQALVQKARSLKTDADAAVAAGNNGVAARLAIEMRSFVMQAANLGNVCNRLQKIDRNLDAGAQVRVKNVEVVKARIMAKTAVKARANIGTGKVSGSGEGEDSSGTDSTEGEPSG